MKTLGAAIAIMGLMTAGAAAQMQPGGGTPSGAPGTGENLAYCMMGGDGSKNCGFRTMASCEAATTGATDKCMPNPGATTGSGATSPDRPQSMPPAGGGSMR